MTDVTRRFRWGASVQAILFHFSTREMKAIERHCRKLIRDFTAAENGEGYRCTIITFEMFEYGFVLAYSFTAEEWVLDLVYFPNFGAPDCNRKPPRRRGHRRVAQDFKLRRRPDLAYLRRLSQQLYKIARDQIGRKLTLFWADSTSMLSLQIITNTMRKTRISYVGQREVSAVIEEFRLFAEQQMRGCSNVVQLVRTKVNDTVSFLAPLSSFAPGWRRSKHELWSVELFGARQEHATSG